MRVTIKDIADRAGVSKTTVSFALNRPGRISVETRERILLIVQELGYVPDPVARTLTTKRLGALGLLLPQQIQEAFRNPYLCEIIRGIGATCEAREISLTMLPPVRGKIIEAARRSFVDGILTLGVDADHEVVELLHRRHIPFVTIDGSPAETTSNVGIDDRRAARELMRYVIDLGHRNILVLGLRPDILGAVDQHFSLVSATRMDGFRDVVAERSLSAGGIRLSTEQVECSRSGGERTALELLRVEQDRPTAVVAMADIVAFGVYTACDRLGLVIPDDVSVVGFDDIPDSSFCKPGLTTIHQPGIEKGMVAASMVLELLDGGDIRHTILPTSLVERSSASIPAGCGKRIRD